ncbi:hypothetical protein PENTCL1PPCAC_23714, partial [Pristionchus entomophagus]
NFLLQMGRLWICLVLGLVAANSTSEKKGEKKVTEEDELLLVQVVIRHADRASTSGKIAENSEQVFFRGHEHLSDQGIDNAHKQGADFRKRYVENGFIDSRMVPNQIYFQSSAVPRVLMSAKSFAAGLFDKTGKGDAVLPPILTQMNMAVDKMLVPDMSCADDWDDMYEKYGFEDDGKSPNRMIQVIKTMARVEVPEDCKNIPLRDLDALIAENSNDLTRPFLSEEQRKCGDGGAKWLMYKYVGMLGGGGEDYNENRAVRTVGLLMDTMLNNLEKVMFATLNIFQAAECGRDCTDLERFRVYYTHDTNVLAIAHLFDAVDLFRDQTPAFSSAFVLELRRSSKGLYVNVVMKNGQDAGFEHIDKCKNRGCSLESVLEEKRRFATSTFVGCSTDEKEEDEEEGEDFNYTIPACVGVASVAALTWLRR